MYNHFPHIMDTAPDGAWGISPSPVRLGLQIPSWPCGRHGLCVRWSASVGVVVRSLYGTQNDHHVLSLSYPRGVAPVVAVKWCMCGCVPRRWSVATFGNVNHSLCAGLLSLEEHLRSSVSPAAVAAVGAAVQGSLVL